MSYYNTKTERTCIEEDNNIYSTFFIFKILFVLNMQLVSNTFKITALVRNDKNILYMHVTNQQKITYLFLISQPERLATCSRDQRIDLR